MEEVKAAGGGRLAFSACMHRIQLPFGLPLGSHPPGMTRQCSTRQLDTYQHCAKHGPACPLGF